MLYFYILQLTAELLEEYYVNTSAAGRFINFALSYCLFLINFKSGFISVLQF